MATKAAAFHAWIQGASGLAAYSASSVPEDAAFPYVTYEWAEGAWGDEGVSVLANMWFKTESEAAPNAAVSRLGRNLGLSGRLLPCDGGGMWVRRGTPWAQSVPDEDASVKRRYLNLEIEFITTS